MEVSDKIVEIKVSSIENIPRLDEVIKSLGGFNTKAYRPSSVIQKYVLPTNSIEQAKKNCKSLGFCKWFNSLDW